MRKKGKTTSKKKGRKIVQSRKVTIDGITFASILESTMYKLLKEAGIKFTYEGQSYETFKPFELEIECWERPTKRSKAMVDRRKVTKVSYTPDFIGENEEWFIEVKGRANESFPLRWKLFKKMLDSKRTIAIFKPMNKVDCQQVVEILKQKEYGKKES